LCVYADWPSLRVDYTEKKRLREKKTKRKKENVLNQNSLGSASRRASTEKDKENLFLCGLTVPQSRLHKEKKD
jgi:hypothetical protein